MNGFLVLHGVGPHQVAEDAVERDLLLAVDLVNLVKHLETGGNTAVHGEVLARDVTRDRHRVEDLHEQVVHVHVEALQDFVAESEGLGHVARLVVSSEHNHILWEVQLDSEEEDTDFDSEDAAIDVVTKEEVVQAARLARFRNHVQQISVLAVNITHDADRLLNLN